MRPDAKIAGGWGSHSDARGCRFAGPYLLTRHVEERFLPLKQTIPSGSNPSILALLEAACGLVPRPYDTRFAALWVFLVDGGRPIGAEGPPGLDFHRTADPDRSPRPFTAAQRS